MEELIENISSDSSERRSTEAVRTQEYVVRFINRFAMYTNVKLV